MVSSTSLKVEPVGVGFTGSVFFFSTESLLAGVCLRQLPPSAQNACCRFPRNVLKKGTILKRSKAGTFGERYAVRKCTGVRACHRCCACLCSHCRARLGVAMLTMQPQCNHLCLPLPPEEGTERHWSTKHPDPPHPHPDPNPP